MLRLIFISLSIYESWTELGWMRCWTRKFNRFMLWPWNTSSMDMHSTNDAHFLLPTVGKTNVIIIIVKWGPRQINQSLPSRYGLTRSSDASSSSAQRGQVNGHNPATDAKRQLTAISQSYPEFSQKTINWTRKSEKSTTDTYVRALTRPCSWFTSLSATSSRRFPKLGALRPPPLLL